jgi:CRISPR-associated protein Csb2
MTLVLEIDHLTGLAFSSRGPEAMEAEWPPQPDRIFSALVATWAARGRDAAEARALEWLEEQETPLVLASAASPRRVNTVFVPPNDAKAGDLGQMPSHRRRQPRCFPAAIPENPVVRLLWSSSQADASVFAALDALARDTSHVGHSASLTRCRFLATAVAPDETARTPERTIYSGRFAELRADFERGSRPSPGRRVTRPAEPENGGTTPSSLFGTEWLLLEPIGQLPDVRAAALLAKAIHKTILKGYGPEATIPPLVCGHDPDGTPTRDPHLAIITLPFVGFPHADGRSMGLALVPPRDADLFADKTFLAALRRVAPLDETEGRRVMDVKSPKESPPGEAFRIRLAPTFSAEAHSLDPALWCRPGRIFATATPIVLDRHLKTEGAEREAEIAEIVALACERIGLPRPKAVAPAKHSALEGAVSAKPPGRAPRWTAWRLPKNLEGRTIVHAVVDFGEPVSGPIVLGAGRFLGLGLCRSIDRERGP